MRIEAITLQRLCVPLTHPYRVALADIRHFDTIIVEIEAETGSRGLGEATVRAANAGASYVKLKLMKMGTLATLVEALAQIHSLGLRSVLGNGVACDIGCWMEAMVAARCLQTTSEMNGFLKPEHPLFVEPLRVKDSELLIPAGFQPRVDWQRVAACLVDKAVYRR